MVDQFNTPPTTSLPEELRNPEDLARIKRVITQWSQLAAWSWTTHLAFDDDDDNQTKKGEELTLKQYFSKLLKNQAMSRMAATEYGDLESAEKARISSDTIKQVLMGKETAPHIKLTLPEVYQQLTEQTDFIFSDPFIDQFRFEVTVDSFTGSIRKNEENNKSEKYVAVIAYPPRPALSEFTVTEQQLNDWMRDKGSGDYLPPSPYIPLTST